MFDQSQISQAKVELLETLVVWLIQREARRQPDPAQATDNLAANLRNQIEEQAKKLPQDEETQLAQVMGLEIFDSLFDRVRSAVQKDPDPN